MSTDYTTHNLNVENSINKVLFQWTKIVDHIMIFSILILVIYIAVKIRSSTCSKELFRLGNTTI